MPGMTLRLNKTADCITNLVALATQTPLHLLVSEVLEL